MLQAATCILVEEGWEGLTTNRVALRAGVNIASLYQYFPNKEAIVAELRRRHIGKVRQQVPTAVQSLQNRPGLNAALRCIVEAVIAEHQDQPVLHRVFSEELPPSALNQAQSHESGLEGMWRECVAPNLVKVPDPDMAAFIVRTVVHAIVHDAAAQRPELLNNPTFAEEVVVLLERYLDRSDQQVLPSTPGHRHQPNDDPSRQD